MQNSVTLFDCDKNKMSDVVYRVSQLDAQLQLSDPLMIVQIQGKFLKQ